MKSFGKFLSVFALSLFCSFFVSFSVNATPPEIASGYSTVNFSSTYQEKTNYVTVSSYFYNLTPGKWYTCTIGFTPVNDDIYIASYRIGNFTINTGGQTFYIGYDVGPFTLSTYLKRSVPAYNYTFTFKAVSETQYYFISARYSCSRSKFTTDTGYSNKSWLYINSAAISLADVQPDGDLATYDDVQSIVGNATQEINTKLTETGDMLHGDLDKTNDSLTNFSGSADMDASKDQLDGVMGDYDQIEGSLFDSGQTAFDQFDPESLLSFSVGITAAIAQISQLMISIISAMGEFSVIYTVGVVLVFFGMLIGLWRFFSK